MPRPNDHISNLVHSALTIYKAASVDDSAHPADAALAPYGGGRGTGT